MKFTKRGEWKWTQNLSSIVNKGEAGRKSFPNSQTEASHTLNFLHMLETINIIMVGH